MDDLEALRRLSHDRRLEELDIYVAPLALVVALGVAHDEVAHSRLLAFLLDPRRHRGAEIMMRALVRELVDRSLLEEHFAERLRTISQAPWYRLTVRRELFFIDIVVEIASADGAVVIGIENKINAVEGMGQIARYQEALRRAYPEGIAVVGFLTPTGREPTTADDESPVPAVAFGYDLVLHAIEESLREIRGSGRDERVLSEMAGPNMPG